MVPKHCENLEIGMLDMAKCTTVIVDDDFHVTISCIFGEWSVWGPIGPSLLKEALYYFSMYKQDGTYDSILEPDVKEE